jgi:FAD/FMN-containing dehydrogenase
VALKLTRKTMFLSSSEKGSPETGFNFSDQSLHIVFTSKTCLMLSEKSIFDFSYSIHGQLLQPHDPDYHVARKVYNGMFDKHPAFIARCADAEDVIASVNFAREHGLLLAIKGGGHNAAGLGMCDDGFVIDLSLLKEISVDPSAKTALVQAGCTLGELDRATHEFGLAMPGGIISTTGVSGLTLGGGLGYLTRHYGLSIDNLLEAEVVLADGSLVKASESENPDLFWAIRGGGGNFGVVISFLFKLHPVHTVYGGPTLWDISDAKEVLYWYRDFIKKAPVDLNGFFAFMTVPPGAPFPEHLHLKKMCGIVWCYTGPIEKADEVFKPIRQFKTPALDFAGPIPFPALQSMFDGLYPPGLQWYWKADFVNELSNEAIDLHIQHAMKLPSMHSTMHLYPVNGVAAKVSRDNTAWNYRDATWAEVIVGVDPDPANKDAITSWARNYWNELHPYSAGGAYINFMMDEGETGIKTSYADNYEKLVRIKTKYDPENLFRVNQNIKPALKNVLA